jgi:low temperature requirement protein LtrA
MPVLSTLSPRDPTEGHRAATPLELFFDLTFAVAVAQAASGLEQGFVSGQARGVLIGYPMVFFAIWWAWMNFTWFASAYDNDGVSYRIAVLVQMIGVLILAAGVSRGLENGDFGVILVGYLVMRLSMVTLWLRAAASDPERRTCALRYAAGITVVQIGWVTWWLALPRPARVWAFLVLAAAEMAVPLWAEGAGRTSWHPGHIAERYGLFTIIVLGETLLAPTVGVQRALDGKSGFGPLAVVVIGGLLIIFSMWWLYFDMPSGEMVGDIRQAFTERLSGAFIWGYGHYLIFGAAAAVGAGLLVSVDQATHHTRLSDLQAGFVITVPVATYLVVVWALHAPYKKRGVLLSVVVPLTAALILASSATPAPVLVTGLLLTALVALSVLLHRPDKRRPGRATAPELSGRRPDRR